MNIDTAFRSHSSTLLGADTVISGVHLITGSDGTRYLHLTPSGDAHDVTVLCASADDLVRLGHTILDIADAALRAEQS